jgi:hypothetical protein
MSKFWPYTEVKKKKIVERVDGRVPMWPKIIE